MSHQPPFSPFDTALSTEAIGSAPGDPATAATTFHLNENSKRRRTDNVRIRQRIVRLCITLGVIAGAASLTATAIPVASGTAAAATKVVVPKPPSASLSETGSTLPLPALEHLGPGVPAEVSAGEGHDGRHRIGDRDHRRRQRDRSDMGSSDAYLSPSETSANPPRRSPRQSAQFIAYNVPGVSTHLKLSGPVLSDIYQGKITTWNASQIRSANPGVNLPSTPIVTLHRSDGSGDTFLFTQYLSKSDPNGWGSKIRATAPRSPRPTHRAPWVRAATAAS